MNDSQSFEGEDTVLKSGVWFLPEIPWRMISSEDLIIINVVETESKNIHNQMVPILSFYSTLSHEVLQYTFYKHR